MIGTAVPTQPLVMALTVGVLLLWAFFGSRARRRARAVDKASAAVARAEENGEVGLLLQVLSDLESDLETMVRHCDFEGDPDDLILEGWDQARGGFLSISPFLRAEKLLEPLEQAGLIGPAMKAKAHAYYYWRAMAGLDLAFEFPFFSSTRKERWENKGLGVYLSRSELMEHAKKALRIGDIVADSAIAVLDAPVVKNVVPILDSAAGGTVTLSLGVAKLAAHGTGEVKKLVEEAKVARVRMDQKRTLAETKANQG